jgi:hypothetical protein
MPVDPRNVEWFDWDDGNVAELAAHDVTVAEPEQVICHDADAEVLRNKRAAAGRWFVIGRTRAAGVTGWERAMSMSKREQDEAAAWFRDAASRPEEWEVVPRPADAPPIGRKLGAQITVRLVPEVAERLRAMADDAGIGYTSLARQLLEQAVLGVTPPGHVASNRLHVERREGVWVLVREGERNVMYADHDRAVVERWARDIATAERGTFIVHAA